MTDFLRKKMQMMFVGSIIFIPSVIASIQPLLSQSIDQADITKLESQAPNLNHEVLKLAVHAYNHAVNQHKVKNHYLTVIDYHLPSNKKRLWIFDLNHDKLAYNTFVAHGKNSGALYAKHFSNTNRSKASSLGTYITKDTYYGGKGLSLNLQGMEHGFNDHAYDRRVVIHGAWYVEPKFIKQSGQAGRSWGCPAIGKSLAKPVINTIKGGSVVFAYYPDKNYLARSSYLV